MPDVSVLMPVFNGSAHLREALASVLAQRGPSFELIVVDDGSSDDSRAIAESVDDSRLELTRNERTQGLPAALNVGLARATGEFVARLDQDDVAHPERLAQQVDYLRRHPQVVLLGSQARLIDQSGKPIGRVERCRGEAAIRWYNILDNPFIHSSVMFRRRPVIDACGGYDASLRLCEDWDLWGRIMERHRAANLDAALVDYRTSPTSMMGAIESSPAHPQRPLFRQLARRLIARHAAHALGAGVVSEQDLELLTGFPLGVDGSTLTAFLAAFDRLLAAFCERYPDARSSVDVHRTVARQFDAIAFGVTPARRAAALRVYAAAVRRGASVARFVPWMRAAALTLFGRAGRDRLRQLRNAARAGTAAA